MRKLLFLGMALALMACGDDDGREPGTDSGTPGVDSGTPGTDSGTPGTDSGTPGTDSGTPGTDSGMAGSCPMVGECDIFTGSGCEAGESCYLAAMTMGEMPVPTCLAAGTVAAGMPCDALNDCADGYVCAGSPTVCLEACCAADGSGCSEPGAICGGLRDIDNFGVCNVPTDCNVIDQTGCGEGLSCVVISNDGATDCRSVPEGGGTQGDPCGSGDDFCAPDHLCLGDGSCSRACNPMDDMCGDGLVCAGVMGFPPTLGGCVPMM